MEGSKKVISGWGNYPLVEASVTTPHNYEELRQYVLDNERFIARGNGKSYGDAALAPKVLSTSALCRIIDFNQQEGIIECESGVLLSDLLPVIIPSGWFFPVTPGIKHISIGGAIASDVHGKNHPLNGCFSRYLISFELMGADGSIAICSKEENADLFWKTCGGMGWTGVILSAKFQLMAISSTDMLQKTIRCQDMAAVFTAFEEHQAAPYAAAWIDTTATGANFGRGALHVATHEAGATQMSWAPPKPKNIPFFAPSWLLNPLSIRAFNAYYFWKNRSKESLVSLDSYFYPLDSLLNWNRLYGRRGLVQYQFCLPEKTAFEGIVAVLKAIHQQNQAPFLSVLKRHGARPTEAVNSFPIKGYSLALDFPRSNAVLKMVPTLDKLVWDLGGKIYLTKDACSAPQMGRIDPANIGDPKFSSAMRVRIFRD